LGRRSTALAWISTTTISVIGSSCHPQRGGIKVLLEVPEALACPGLASPAQRLGIRRRQMNNQKKDAYSAPGQADAKWKQLVLVFSPSRTKKRVLVLILIVKEELARCEEG
jgi:hypothetical protein